MDRQAAEERRWLTVFFADLSGFTRLSSTLDPEDVREAVNICFEQLNQPIVEQGGTIHKYEGDLVMALFGYPEGHEDDPERAVKTALAMMTLMPVINNRLRTRLKISDGVGLHVGINSGLVVVGEIGSQVKRELTVMGDAVNLASRLNDAAENGEILVSETIFRQTDYLFDYETRPAIMVKGKAEAVRIFLPRGLKKQPGSKRGLVGLSSPLVDREPESAALQRAFRDPTDERQRIVFISGEAGLGKTRLLTEFKDRLTRGNPDARFLEGVCFSHTANVPYGPIRAILKQALGIRDDDAAQTVLEKIRTGCSNPSDDIAPYLCRLLAPEFEDKDDVRVRYLEGKELQQQVRLTLKNFLGRLGSFLVLIIDDFHWIDPESLSFLGFLGTSRPALPVLIILSSRSETENPSWRQVQDLRDKPYIDFRGIDLPPLDERSTRELLNNLLIVDGPDKSLREQIRTRSSGNPFFLEEMIKSFIEQGGGKGTELPESLQAVLTSRLDRLNPDARDVLLAASVIGRIFDLRILETIVSDDETTLALNLAFLEDHGFLRRRSGDGPIEYSFTHPLLQEAAYQRLLKKLRRELHRLIGAAAEVIYADQLETQTDFLARHYGLGDDDEKAIVWLTRAGDRAKKDFANDEAIGYYLSLVDRLKETGAAGLAGVYETLGELAALKSDFPTAFDYYRRMNEVSREKVDRARSRRKSAEVYYNQGRFDEALTELREAEELAKGGTDAADFELAEIDVDRCWVYNLKGDGDRAIEAGLRALSRIARLTKFQHDPAAILLQSKANNNLGSVYNQRGEFALAGASYQAGLDLAHKVDDQRSIAIGYNNLGIVASLQGDQTQAVKYFHESGAIGERIGDRQSVAIARCNLGMVNSNQGKYDQALEDFKAYLKTSEEIGDRRCQMIAHVNLGNVRRKQDRFDEALAFFSKACELGEEIGDKQNLDIAFLNIGTILRDRGEFEHSREYFEKSKRLAEEIGDRIGVALADGYEGEGLRRQGQLVQARELVEKFQSSMEELNYKPGLANALYYLGLIEMDAGNEAKAREVLKRAEEIAKESGDPEWIQTIRDARQNLKNKM